jgi:hypothetical protein
MGAADDVIEPLIAQHESFAGGERLEPLAAALPLLAPRLEQVRIIGVHRNSDRERKLRVSIVMNADAFVTCAIPEKSGAAEMQGASRHEVLSIGGKIGVREVDREKRVILLQSGTEQKGSVCSERQLTLGKKTRAFMIEALWTRNDLMDVTVTVEDGERLSVLQHFYAGRGQRRRGEDVELIVPADDLAHERVSRNIGAQVRLILRAKSAVANITIPIPNRPGPGP